MTGTIHMALGVRSLSEEIKKEQPQSYGNASRDATVQSQQRWEIRHPRAQSLHINRSHAQATYG
jgi:hypothetical protein